MNRPTFTGLLVGGPESLDLKAVNEARIECGMIIVGANGRDVIRDRYVFVCYAWLSPQAKDALRIYAPEQAMPPQVSFTQRWACYRIFGESGQAIFVTDLERRPNYGDKVKGTSLS